MICVIDSAKFVKIQSHLSHRKWKDISQAVLKKSFSPLLEWWGKKTHAHKIEATHSSKTTTRAFQDCTAYLFNTMGCATSVEEIPAVHDGKTFPVVGDKSIMKKKAHGTSETPVQKNLRWSCNVKQADKICNFNRHFAEPAGT